MAVVVSEESLPVRLARAVAELKRLRAESRAAIKAAYLANECSVEAIARSFSTTSGEIQRRARKEGWARRAPVQVASQRERRKQENRRKDADRLDALYAIPSPTKFGEAA